jgi:hypothetical protein
VRVTNETRNLEAFLLARDWAMQLIESLIERIAALGWGRMTIDEDIDNPVEVVVKDGKPVMLHCNEGDFDLGGKVITRIVRDVKLTDDRD